MNAKALQKWESTRALGMTRFVLVRGVLMYGLAMFVAMTFFAHQGQLSAIFIMISAILWLIGGAVFGVVSWYLLEALYRRALRKALS
jgi:hypothetical protein